MSSWEILADGDNTFRWEVSDRCLDDNPEDELRSPSSRLPSMADLVLQGCSELGQIRTVETPMFRTGSRKSVAVQKSSMVKALSVFGEDVAVESGKQQDRDNGSRVSNSHFQSASGKMVNLSSNNLARAKTLLGLEEGIDDRNQYTRKLLTIPTTAPEPNQSNHFSSPESSGGFSSSTIKSVQLNSSAFLRFKTGLTGSNLKNDAYPNLVQPEMYNPKCKQSPIKFHTAGGRSISISTDALQRARSLLGDPELGAFLNEGDPNGSTFQCSNQKSSNGSLPCGMSTPHTSSGKEMAENKNMIRSFTSPLQLSSKKHQLLAKSISSGTNLIKKFDAVVNENDCKTNGRMHCQQQPSHLCNHMQNKLTGSSLSNGIASRTNHHERSSGGAMIDISNTMNNLPVTNACSSMGKRRLTMASSTSPFKMPRSSKFSTPFKRDVAVFTNGFSSLSSEKLCCTRKVSTRFPFQNPRVSIRKFFAVPPSESNMLVHVPDQVRQIKSDNAEKYIFYGGFDLNGVGAEAFFYMLAQAGASTQFASKEWVTNHYKWIVWKLACYERFYPARFAGKFLTASNVLEELKYRYERERKHGHRSAIKRILEGDSLSSSMMILCISSIHSNCNPESRGSSEPQDCTQRNDAVKVELTDGWYSINAILDLPLTKQLDEGKLFTGQKLRIWGAGLSGWVGPISPFEVSSDVNLLLHINGTYRAHWADQLGFCKGIGPPLAFRCIKSNGGLVPWTFAGITRIYPVLYKERLSNGGSIVRSEKMENKVMQLHNQRCSIVVEGIVSEFHSERNGLDIHSDSDSEEGAKIYKRLETAAEPDILMADMTPEQLNSFAAYQAKLKVTRQSELEKLISKALKDAGLKDREVTPFLRMRVVGLTSKSCNRPDGHREGLITIWNPTEKQRYELVEGQAYAIAGLIPSSFNSDTLHLQARGPSSKWQPLSPKAREQFKSFFSQRKSICLSGLNNIPLSSEFDIAALVVHVGEVYRDGHQKKQWVFVTDGSIPRSKPEVYYSLLAISFCSPSVDDSFEPVNLNLVGSTVGFCNLIKRPKDHLNQIWVAEATENSTYILSFDSSQHSHLKKAANCTEKWGEVSISTIEKIREKVLFIIGDSKR